MGMFMKVNLLLIVGCVLVGAITRCRYRTFLGPQQTYYIYSPGFPFNYTSEIQCHWTMTSPPGYVCRLNCSEVVMTQSPSCAGDRLMVSRYGDPLLRNPDVYCDRGAFTVVSVGPRITLSLITQQLTPGGRFFCEVTAVFVRIFLSALLLALNNKPRTSDSETLKKRVTKRNT